jgi:hypothetical protein
MRACAETKLGISARSSQLSAPPERRRRHSAVLALPHREHFIGGLDLTSWGIRPGEARARVCALK